jgi:hypothetical protein
MNEELFLEYEAEKKPTHLIELHVRNPLVVSFSQRSETLRPHHLV